MSNTTQTDTKTTLALWRSIKTILILLCCAFGLALLSCKSVSATCTTDSTTGDVTCTDSATATVHVSEACTMNATLNTPHIAEMTNGLYQTNIGSTTLNVVCNDASGFSIYAVGYTNDEFGNTKLMSNPSDNTAPFIDTGTTHPGNTSNWSMKLILPSSPSTYQMTLDNSFNDYHNVPSTYTRVAYRSAGTDAGTSPTGSSVNATYAAYISPTEPANTYTGQVKYTLVHPMTNVPHDAPIDCPANSICYGANANDIEGTMGVQTKRDGTNDITSNTEVTLLASNYSRKGYGFAGWSESQNAASDPTAKIYGPQETFTIGDVSTKGMSLYAVWVKSVGSLQDQSKVTELCGTGPNALAQAPNDGTANITSVSALTDQRDNQTYAIAKLADGKCWMIENMRLNSTAELTITNTNNPLNDGVNVTLKHNYTDTNTFTNLSSASTVAYDADTAPDGWCITSSAACDNQSRLRTDNTTNRATSNPSTNAVSLYSYGNNYNWYSATAGRGTYEFRTKGNSVVGDLCPAGWRLPRGGDRNRIESNGDNDFWNLTVIALNNNTLPANYSDNVIPYYVGVSEATPVANMLRAYPNNYIYSSYVEGGTAYRRGATGIYWSSTTSSYNEVYRLYISNSQVLPGTNNGLKYLGWAVRCIASDT